MKAILQGLVLLIHITLAAQVKNLYETEGFTYDVHKANLGRITFMFGNIPLHLYKRKDFLKVHKLTRKSDLNMRVFMDNSVINYLHQLEPTLTEEELLKCGNLQFTFYIDDKIIYIENIHYGCNFGSGGNKKTSTTFRVPLTSSKGEDWWSMYMWDRFKLNGGDKALTEGTHKLKIIIKPYIKYNGEIKTGNIIADGEIELITKSPIITPEEIVIHPIASGSGFPLSSHAYKKDKIEELNTSIAADKLKDITSIIVIYKGELLLEEYFNGANRNTLHDTRSASKSFTSTLMGIAIQQGYIKNEEQLLGSFYNLETYENYSITKKNITLKHLLTMSSAFSGSDTDGNSPGNEENMYPSSNWVKFTLDLPVDENKVNGGQWDYFTAGVVVLGDILDKKVPGGLGLYADENLFKPLQITNYKWQYTPQHVVNTAGSLMMTSLDYAKYAQLYKDKGMWNGNQLLPSDWVKKTFTRHLPISGRQDEFYGYLFWNKTFLYNDESYDAYYCAGNGGNQFVIFNELPLVIIITSQAYNKPYGHKQADEIICNYILPAILN